MKKLLVSLMVLSMVLVGCGNGESTTKDAEIILITDKGTINDKSFNQGSWEGVVAFGEKTNRGTAYIQPLDATDEEYLNSIAQAVERGAKVIVTPGFLFGEAIKEAQDKYPEVKFVLIDEHLPVVNPNTIAIKYREYESGYLAGYAAVKEGATSLGFMGGMAVPAVVSFGFGYVQGANDAAEELDVDVSIKYHYTGGFSATPEVQTLAAAWYKDGVEIIFACGGAVGNSVMAAASATDGDAKVWVIGVDVDQSSESPTVITSAYKQLSVSVESALEAIFDGSFESTDPSVIYKGGENIVLGASENAVGLPMETSRFENFTKADYDVIFNKIVDGVVEILGHGDVLDSSDSVTVSPLGLTVDRTTRVTIEEVN